MTATPATMVRQIAAAKAAVIDRGQRPVYTTTTGDPIKVETVTQYEEYCFICSRCTDHAGEDHTDRDGNYIPQREETYTTRGYSNDGRVYFITHHAYVYRA